MKTIVLLNGLPRAGKDTVADFMVKKGFTKLAFANALKEIMASTFGMTLSELDEYKNNPEKYGLELKAYPDNQPSSIIEYISFREILQRFGTEGMKPIFGNAIWADIVYDKIEKENLDKVVISDFRFLTEHQKRNARIISVLIQDDRELPTIGHASDVELYANKFKFDFTINNIGTLEELSEKVDNIISELI